MLFLAHPLVNLIFPAAECHNSCRMRSQDLRITAVRPSLGVPGGVVEIQCCGFRPGLPGQSRVVLGPAEARIVTASEERVISRLPNSPAALGIALDVHGKTSPLYPFVLATRLAAGLHPVTSPAIAPDGSVITTISGSRGQQVQQPLVKVNQAGEKIPFSCEIMNPTGLAFSPDGQLYISSRHDGTVLRYTDYEDLEVFADDLGIATGLAFDSKGFLYVGDRAGKIYCIDPLGVKKEHASLEPSVSAYHLAMDSSDRLYVTGPTLSMRDVLYRIPAQGQVEIVLSGLARPQGMAFLSSGDLLIAASHGGKKGIFRYSPRTGELAHFIAGPTLIGLAVRDGEIIIADGNSIFGLRPEPGVAPVV